MTAFFKTRIGRLILHDGSVALAAGYAAWDAAGRSLTWGAGVVAGVVAVKAFLRLILPVPAAPDAPRTSGVHVGTVTVKVTPDTDHLLDSIADALHRAAEGVTSSKPKAKRTKTP